MSMLITSGKDCYNNDNVNNTLDTNGEKTANQGKQTRENSKQQTTNVYYGSNVYLVLNYGHAPDLLPTAAHPQRARCQHY